MPSVRPFPAYPGLLDSEDPRWAKTGEILNEYNPIDAFWRVITIGMSRSPV